MNTKLRWLIYTSVMLGITTLIVLLTFPQSIVFDLFTYSSIFLGLAGAYVAFSIIHFVVFVIASVFYGLFWFFFFFSFGILFLASFGTAVQIHAEEKALPSVSILIAALNEEEFIETLLTNLVNANYPKEKLEILAITSGSTDRTEEICRKFKEVTVLNEPLQRSGKPAAMNYGLRNAKNDVIVAYDADVIVPPDSLMHLAAVLTDPQYDASSGTVQIRNQKTPTSRGVALEFTFFSGRGLFFEIKQRLDRHPLYFGSNSAIRKSVLLEIGGYNEDDLVEDLRVAFELRRRDKKVGFAPEARVTELTPTNFRDLYNQRSRWIGGFKQVADEYKRDLGPITGLSQLIHLQLPLYFVLIPVFILLISLISFFAGLPLNLPILLSNPALFVLQSFDWMVITFSIGALVFIIGLLFNAVRKYADKKYGLLLALPTYLRNQWLYYRFQSGMIVPEVDGWKKTEKST